MTIPIRANEWGWVLETKTMGYAFGINDAGRLTHRYWGIRLPYLEDYPQAANPSEHLSFDGAPHLTREEYAGYASRNYTEPGLKVTFADGVRDLVLRVDVVEQDGDEQNTCHIRLRDASYPFCVTLHYRVHPTYDLLERWVTITNESEEAVLLERVFSAQWHVPPDNEYRLTYTYGRWADEMHLRRETLAPGTKVLESRRLTTSHQHNPWFALDRGSADEESGEVWFGVLAWSGNWKLAAEVTAFASTRLTLGINDWDFAWRLEGGQSFTTPSSYAGYTTGGFGAASRLLHTFIREKLVPHPRAKRKVLYNSWEATAFAVDEPSQLALARHAAKMGVELFVMDDGWFHHRDQDNAGLGDWWPDQKKFPRGLAPLIEGVNALGMDFGLWIEPEMVNVQSDLYRAHPDWVLHFPTRARTEARHQLILNIARADVQDYLIAQLSALLSAYHITFIKWDMNRNVGEAGWPEAPGDQREIWVRYVQGLYHIWGTLRERYPDVIWQSCSGGGGRADLAILRLADQIWVSDNTEATARLAIQEGFSQIFPASTMEAWVTDAEQAHIPLRFRFHVSMCGVLGIGGHLSHWSVAQQAEAKELIAHYKEIRHLVQFGDLYRLRSAQSHSFSALQYMSADQTEGVLFAFRAHLPSAVELPSVYLRGLDAEAHYAIEGFEETRSGKAWMYAGLHLALDNFESLVLHIYKVS